MTTTYKGQYPYNIKSVASIKAPGHVICTTNNGERYLIEAKANNGKMPQLNQSIFDFSSWQLVSPSAKKA